MRIAAVTLLTVLQQQGVDKEYSVEENDEMEISDSEVLDEITTSRGELKLRSISFDEKFVQVSAQCCINALPACHFRPLVGDQEPRYT